MLSRTRGPKVTDRAGNTPTYAYNRRGRVTQRRHEAGLVRPEGTTVSQPWVANLTARGLSLGPAYT